MTWWVIAAGCLAGACAAGLLTLRGRYRVIQVGGLSMVPTLRPGDRLLVRRAGLPRLRAGMIIVLRDWPGSGTPRPGRRPAAASGLLVKRLAALPGDPVPEVARQRCKNATVVPAGMAVVLSDNVSGTDSRTWGFASASQLVGYAARPLPRSRRAAAEPPSPAALAGR
jgi:signal peptidase I